jgi:hypothetical protein
MMDPLALHADPSQWALSIICWELLENFSGSIYVPSVAFLAKDVRLSRENSRPFQLEAVKFSQPHGS